jgi:hypothetical protein
MWRLRKVEMYALKSQAIHHLVEEGKLKVVGHHEFSGGWAEILEGEQYRLHRPCPEPDKQAVGKGEFLGEIEAKPKDASEPRLKDAIFTIEAYLLDKPWVESYSWPPRTKPIRSCAEFDDDQDDDEFEDCELEQEHEEFV